MAQSHFLKMEVKFTSRGGGGSVLERTAEATPTRHRRRKRFRSLRPSIRLARRDVILGRRRSEILLLCHRREPRLVEGVKEGEEEWRKTEERGGREGGDVVMELGAASRQRNYFDAA